VWESESWEKHTIIKKIADHVLTKHLSLQKEDLIHVVDQLDFCLLVGGQDPVSSSGALFEAFDSLAKKLRLLGDVPLKISTVQPLDPGLTYNFVCFIFTLIIIFRDMTLASASLLLLYQLLDTRLCFLLSLILWHMKKGLLRGCQILQLLACDH
jgi:hypothetical protein